MVSNSKSLADQKAHGHDYRIHLVRRVGRMRGCELWSKGNCRIADDMEGWKKSVRRAGALPAALALPEVGLEDLASIEAQSLPKNGNLVVILVHFGSKRLVRQQTERVRAAGRRQRQDGTGESSALPVRAKGCPIIDRLCSRRWLLACIFLVNSRLTRKPVESRPEGRESAFELLSVYQVTVGVPIHKRVCV